MVRRRVLRPFAFCLALVFCLPPALLFGASDQIQKGEMAGYLGVPYERAPEMYGGGFSMYVAAWPLLEEYPGPRLQTGLLGTSKK